MTVEASSAALAAALDVLLPHPAGAADRPPDFLRLFSCLISSVVLLAPPWFLSGRSAAGFSVTFARSEGRR